MEQICANAHTELHGVNNHNSNNLPYLYLQRCFSLLFRLVDSFVPSGATTTAAGKPEVKTQTKHTSILFLLSLHVIKSLQTRLLFYSLALLGATILLLITYVGIQLCFYSLANT